jgi:prepilin-type N-terminal cleavage/methylation domain-containing protein/prepilin-type processing-associated H-X9-DG protein
MADFCPLPSLKPTQCNRFHRLPRGQRAFTLIELLVVIAIISLLVSILLPSLNKAKELAVRVVCANNQRATGLGIGIYASERGDALPWIIRTKDRIDLIHMAYWSYSSGSEFYQGMGLLYPDYVDDPRVFYCPAAVSGSFSTYESEWEEDWEQIGENVFTGFSPGWFNDTSSTPDRFAPYRLSSFATRPLYSDHIYHKVLVTHRDGFNVLYGDGHVSWFNDSDKDVYDIIPEGSTDDEAYYCILGIFEDN